MLSGENVRELPDPRHEYVYSVFGFDLRWNPHGMYAGGHGDVSLSLFPPRRSAGTWSLHATFAFGFDGHFDQVSAISHGVTVAGAEDDMRKLLYRCSPWLHDRITEARLEKEG